MQYVKGKKVGIFKILKYKILSSEYLKYQIININSISNA